jgi:hypothetical protein
VSAALRNRRRAVEWTLGALLALWALAPLALMIVHSARTGVPLTGADGPLAPDVLQYLAWVRDAGSHGLAGDLFDLGPQKHVWVHPMFTLSGLAVRLGAGVIAAYLAWTPVAIGALFAAALMWARELVGPGSGRLAALALALFLNNPLRAFVDANAAALGHFKSQLVQATSEPFAAGLLWGYLPSVIAIALMPVCLVAAARAVRPAPGARERPDPLPLATAGLAALLAAWLHPWQGVVLILILVGVSAWARRRRELWLAVPVAAAAAPLPYYAALGHYDAAWHSSQDVTAHFPHWSAGVLLLALGPLLVVGAAGLRRSPDGVLERALVLWIPAALLGYFVLPFPAHALEGISFPLAVLIVRGWQRLRLASSRRGVPATPLALAAAALILIATLPGMLVDARDFRNLARASSEYFYLRPDERRALDYVAHTAPAGAVLAPLPLATAVPAHTGRVVWVGHSYWTPDFDRRALAVQQLFGATLTPAAAQSLVNAVRAPGARLLVSDCTHRADLTALLGARLRSVHRFGCAAVYVLA